MSAASLIAQGRAAAARLMTNSCTITRVTATGTDPDTGEQTKSSETIYTGKCRVQTSPTGSAGTAKDLGQAAVFQQAYELQIPIDGTTGVEVGDVVTITASPLDADLVDRKFWVRDLAHKTHATARRLGMEEVTS